MQEKDELVDQIQQIQIAQNDMCLKLEQDKIMQLQEMEDQSEQKIHELTQEYEARIQEVEKEF